MFTPRQISVVDWSDIIERICDGQYVVFDSFSYGDANHTLVCVEQIIDDLRAGPGNENDLTQADIDNLGAALRSLPEGTLICFDG